jgi:hypothetical protein
VILHFIPLFVALTAHLALSSACSSDGPATGDLGIEGDTCQATADCELTLSCLQQECRPSDGSPDRSDEGGEGTPGDPERPPYVTFVEIGGDAGVRRDPSHGSAGVLDWDGDGRPDLFVTAPERAYALFRNKGDGTFEDVAVQAGLTAMRNRGGFGALVADFDNDGDPDVFVTRNGFGDPAANSLLRNDDGVFFDVAAEVGITGAKRTIGGLFLDFDGDGWLDLYVVNGLKDGDANTLYRNLGDGTFEDATASAGVGDEGRGFQAVAGDYDGDDDLDLFVAPENEWDAVNAWLNAGTRLQSAVVPARYRNDGDDGFVDVAEEAGVIGVYAGRSVIECDCDNDTRTDIVVGAGSPGPGAPGWNPVYRNLGGGKFLDESTQSRVGPTAMTHGMTISDFDGDGFEDIYLIPGHTLELGAVHGNALYRNEGNDNGWLKVRLQGTLSNRDAIGARVLLSVDGRRQVREVRGGQPFAGTRDKTLVFGLGTADSAARLEVRWPSGKVTEQTTGLDNGGLISLVEPR